MNVYDMPDAEGIFDSHFHLAQMRAKGMDVDALLDACFAKGFRGGVDCAVGIEDFESRIELSAGRPSIGLSAGLYPSESEGDWRKKLPLLEEQCRHHRVVAVGETGIDLFRHGETADEQKALFRGQIEVAEAAKLPLIIHCRMAENEVLTVLREAKPTRRGVLHCFSSDYETAVKFLDLGFYVSFAGNLTYPKSAALQEAAARLPPDCILIETDAPYLAPQPVRGRPNHPGYAAYTCRFLAELRGVPIAEMIRRTSENFRGCFPLSRGEGDGFRSLSRV